MNQEQLFNTIQSQLLPILQQFLTTGTAKISADEKMLLKQVYKIINPTATPDINCSSCVLHVLHVIASYYEREYKLYNENNHMSSDSAAKKTTSTEAPAKKKIIKKKTIK